jgi:AcrR family transcriptional regulator
MRPDWYAKAERTLAAIDSYLKAVHTRLRIEAIADRLAAKYDPNQPRVPAGNGRASGRWRNELEAWLRARPNRMLGIAQDRARGHHFVARGAWPQELSPEARRVFERATTGPLTGSFHRWTESHRAYNEAVKQELNRFMASNGTTPERMTAEQARSFVDRIRTARDPVIGGYNRAIMYNEVMSRLRRGNIGVGRSE